MNDYLPALETAESLVAAEEAKGIPRSRIVLGGFSQGGAVSILWGLLNQREAAQKLAGLVLFAT